MGNALITNELRLKLGKSTWHQWSAIYPDLDESLYPTCFTLLPYKLSIGSDGMPSVADTHVSLAEEWGTLLGGLTQYVSLVHDISSCPTPPKSSSLLGDYTTLNREKLQEAPDMTFVSACEDISIRARNAMDVISSALKSLTPDPSLAAELIVSTALSTIVNFSVCVEVAEHKHTSEEELSIVTPRTGADVTEDYADLVNEHYESLLGSDICNKTVRNSEDVEKMLCSLIEDISADPLQAIKLELSTIVIGMLNFLSTCEKARDWWFYLVDEVTGVPVLDASSSVYPHCFNPESSDVTRYLLSCLRLSVKTASASNLVIGMAGLLGLPVSKVPRKWKVLANSPVRFNKEDSIGEFHIFEEILAQVIEGDYCNDESREPQDPLEKYHEYLTGVVDPLCNFAACKRLGVSTSSCDNTCDWLSLWTSSEMNGAVAKFDEGSINEIAEKEAAEAKQKLSCVWESYQAGIDDLIKSNEETKPIDDAIRNNERNDFNSEFALPRLSLSSGKKDIINREGGAVSPVSVVNIMGTIYEDVKDDTQVITKAGNKQSTKALQHFKVFNTSLRRNTERKVIKKAPSFDEMSAITSDTITNMELGVVRPLPSRDVYKLKNGFTKKKSGGSVKSLSEGGRKQQCDDKSVATTCLNEKEGRIEEKEKIENSGKESLHSKMARANLSSRVNDSPSNNGASPRAKSSLGTNSSSSKILSGLSVSQRITGRGESKNVTAANSVKSAPMKSSLGGANSVGGVISRMNVSQRIANRESNLTKKPSSPIETSHRSKLSGLTSNDERESASSALTSRRKMALTRSPRNSAAPSSPAASTHSASSNKSTSGLGVRRSMLRSQSPAASRLTNSNSGSNSTSVRAPSPSARSFAGGTAKNTSSFTRPSPSVRSISTNIRDQPQQRGRPIRSLTPSARSQGVNNQEQPQAKVNRLPHSGMNKLSSTTSTLTSGTPRMSKPQIDTSDKLTGGARGRQSTPSGARGRQAARPSHLSIRAASPIRTLSRPSPVASRFVAPSPMARSGGRISGSFGLKK